MVARPFACAQGLVQCLLSGGNEGARINIKFAVRKGGRPGLPRGGHTVTRPAVYLPNRRLTLPKVLKPAVEPGPQIPNTGEQIASLGRARAGVTQFTVEDVEIRKIHKYSTVDLHLSKKSNGN